MLGQLNCGLRPRPAHYVRAAYLAGDLVGEGGRLSPQAARSDSGSLTCGAPARGSGPARPDPVGLGLAPLAAGL